MNERDIRAVENMARTGMSLDDLRKLFPVFPMEEVEKIYNRIQEGLNHDQAMPQFKMNCS